MKREKNPRRIAVALTIAGSDSGGGAGLQADLKTFAALGVHGTTVVTAVTAQNPRRVMAVQPCSPLLVRKQLAAIFAELPPTAVKTGMLYSAANIGIVADFLRSRRVPLIVDPVMISTSGAPLLDPDAIRILGDRLLPLAMLITPNLGEAAALLGTRLRSVEDLRKAAKALHRLYDVAVLVKGGHLRGVHQAVDIFYDGKEELLLSASFVRGIKTHGTGCTYSAAITGYLAKGFSLKTSVAKAKEFVTQAIAHCRVAGRHDVLNCFWAGARS
ncbi:MAG TPA: bifunctional hydroxymethylpyrimidine kinase/phosphomethylpyrimidine kinase [Verrucomicrobiae bacterium]|nr:bifunctional hydroxymethylpyrimidine kinase/phosphomethylpyrimidine kinase [Verrucomicrobiae bacterium]